MGLIHVDVVQAGATGGGAVGLGGSACLGGFGRCGLLV